MPGKHGESHSLLFWAATVQEPFWNRSGMAGLSERALKKKNFTKSLKLERNDALPHAFFDLPGLLKISS